MFMLLDETLSTQQSTCACLTLLPVVFFVATDLVEWAHEFNPFHYTPMETGWVECSNHQRKDQLS